MAAKNKIKLIAVLEHAILSLARMPILRVERLYAMAEIPRRGIRKLIITEDEILTIMQFEKFLHSTIKSNKCNSYMKNVNNIFHEILNNPI